ncbi:MAG: hypothetical protein JWO67_5467 [Streptosporangiaceae bacterium]|nr:hypothetical protein [Streptosporangiaceae bacterium]
MIPPGPIGRDEARELARRELGRPIYHRDEPSLLERLLRKISDWLSELFSTVADPTRGGSRGGWIALVVIVVLLLAVLALVFRVMRGRRNARSGRGSLLAQEPSAARDHRADAERHAAAGEWAHAIRERLRAVARDLEERAIVEPRPGRTADELAEEAAQTLPDLAEALHAGVRVFDDVWYGDRPGTREGYEQLTLLDRLLQTARPRPPHAGEPADANSRSPR